MHQLAAQTRLVGVVAVDARACAAAADARLKAFAVLLETHRLTASATSFVCNGIAI